MLFKNRLRLGLVSSGLAVVLVCACTNQQEQRNGASTVKSDAGSSGDEPGAIELPPEHPPLPQTESPMTVAPVPADAGTGKTGLTWTPPGAWVVETPTSSMRRAQYRVPGPGGDGECVVYYFGPGQGGTAMDVAQLWADQFTQPDGRSSRDMLEIKTIEVNGINVLMSTISGTYATRSPMTREPQEELPGYMLLGAAAKGPDANWFFKFTGPRATVESQRAAFEAMLGSIERGS